MAVSNTLNTAMDRQEKHKIAHRKRKRKRSWLSIGALLALVIRPSQGNDGKCLSSLKAADHNVDSQIDRKEYMVFLSQMSDGPYQMGGNMGAFDDLPALLQSNFWKFACRCQQSAGMDCCSHDVSLAIDIRGLQPGIPFTLQQHRFIQRLCRHTRSAVMAQEASMPRGSAAAGLLTPVRASEKPKAPKIRGRAQSLQSNDLWPTGPVNSPRVQAYGSTAETSGFPSSTPLAQDGGEISPGEVGDPELLQRCYFALTVSDIDYDNILNQTEFLSFANQMGNHTWVGVSTFSALPQELQLLYFEHFNGINGIDIRGSKPAQRATSLRRKSAASFCMSSIGAINQLLFPTGAPAAPVTKLPTGSPSRSPTAALAPIPPTLRPTVATSTCYVAMYVNDQDRDGFLDREEYAGFVDQMSGNEFGELSFFSLHIELRTRYNELATIRDLGIDIQGSRPGTEVTREQLAFLDKVCYQVDQSIARVLDSFPVVAPSTAMTDNPVLELTTKVPISIVFPTTEFVSKTVSDVTTPTPSNQPNKPILLSLSNQPSQQITSTLLDQSNLQIPSLATASTQPTEQTGSIPSIQPSQQVSSIPWTHQMSPTPSIPPSQRTTSISSSQPSQLVGLIPPVVPTDRATSSPSDSLSPSTFEVPDLSENRTINPVEVPSPTNFPLFFTIPPLKVPELASSGVPALHIPPVSPESPPSSPTKTTSPTSTLFGLLQNFPSSIPSVGLPIDTTVFPSTAPSDGPSILPSEDMTVAASPSQHSGLGPLEDVADLSDLPSTGQSGTPSSFASTNPSFSPESPSLFPSYVPSSIPMGPVYTGKVYFDFSNAVFLDEDNLVSGRRRSHLNRAFENLARAVIGNEVLEKESSQENGSDILPTEANLLHRVLVLGFCGGKIDGVSNKQCPDGVPEGTKCLNATASFALNMWREENPLQTITTSEIQIRDAIVRGHLQAELDELDSSRDITIEEGDVRTRKVPLDSESLRTRGFIKGIAVGLGVFSMLCTLLSCCLCSKHGSFGGALVTFVVKSEER